MPITSDALNAEKQALRCLMRIKRAEAYAQNPGAPLALRDRFLESIIPPPASIFATTVAQSREINPAPLNEALLTFGHNLCLPVVTGPEQSLSFRAWRPGELLLPGAFSLPEPPVTAPAVVPTVILVPLLAFDRQGHRLGQGGGYYDRTLSCLRARHKILAIGLGFSAQELPTVPAGPGDEPLDVIATEKEAFWVIAG
jgi:5-formyltetrahydrofolate cyclo-ligase